MAAGLYETEPVFKRSIDRCDELFAPWLDRPLKRLLLENSDSGAINDTVWRAARPVCIEIALADLWRSIGIVPDAVLGHSVGEFSAAYVAGSPTLEDVVQMVAIRGRLMQALPQVESWRRSRIRGRSTARPADRFDGCQHRSRKTVRPMWLSPEAQTLSIRP